jgi:hypothetical protein
MKECTDIHKWCYTHRTAEYTNSLLIYRNELLLICFSKRNLILAQILQLDLTRILISKFQLYDLLSVKK